MERLAKENPCSVFSPFVTNKVLIRPQALSTKISLGWERLARENILASWAINKLQRK